MTSLRSGSATDVGKVRTSNQDVALEDPDLFAVADGMGGHVGGEVAARVAVDSLRAAFQRQPTVEGLRRAVAQANRAVWSQGQTESGLRGMGTTLTATALVEAADGRQVVALANVGDSRAYVFSRGQVIQVTADHSLAEEKVRQGQLTEAEAAVHPHRHILTRALGVSSDVDVDLWELHLHDGDRILLCSDGLTNEIGDERIGQILTAQAEPADAARSLVKAAVDHGGSDNVTCVVIDVVGASAPGAATGGAAEAAGLAERRSSKQAAGAAAAGAAGAAGAKDGDDAEGGDAGDEEAAPHEGNGREGASNGVHEADATRTLRAVGGTGGAATRTTARNRTRATGQIGAGGTVAGSTDRPRDSDAHGPAEGPGEDPRAADGGSLRAPGALSAARVQAAELRRLQPTRQDRRYRRRSAGVPRLVTVRSVLFVILLLAVVAAAYVAVRWYAQDNWYVGVDHGHLAVYQGRPGGFLWFKPQLVDETGVTTSEVPSYAALHNHQEPSLGKAKRYIRNLHQAWLTTKGAATGTTPSASAGSTSGTPGGSTSTSTTTGAFAPPAAAWQ